VTADCHVNWRVYQREGWLQKLAAAEAELKRDLGAPICPQEITDELHPITSNIRLNQAPISYIGKRTYSDWTDVPLALDAEDKYYIDICDAELAGVSIDDVQVSYPDTVLDCYYGRQTLQKPCITAMEADCGGSSLAAGYHLTWETCQLVHPAENEAAIPAELEKLITSVKWRASVIDTSLAVEVVGECSCDCCEESTLTATIADATEGIICLDNGCNCASGRVRINYAVGFIAEVDRIDPGLEEAVVLLALVKSAGTPVKPCGCDNKYTDKMLEMDPTATTEFAHKLRYGPSNAGMAVWRTMAIYKERPNFNQPGIMGGGMLTGRRPKTRRPSYMRGK
jgi:hypothetical protein